MAFNWTESRVKKLEKLWAKNVPARDIAKQLGNGITRNAIIGKAKRVGLPRVSVTKEKVKLYENDDALLETKGCRWPYGDPGEENFHFCGSTQVPGKPYCLEHCHLAYRRKEPKK